MIFRTVQLYHRLTAYSDRKKVLAHRSTNFVCTKRYNDEMFYIKIDHYYLLMVDKRNRDLLLILKPSIHVGKVIFSMSIRYSVFRIIPQCGQFFVDFFPLITIL